MPTIASVVARRGNRRSSRRVAWIAPVVVTAGVVVGAAIAAPSSGAAPTLPRRSAAQLLTAVQQHAAGAAFSGVVRETSNLGLPSLPGPESQASLNWQTFLTGSHSARVWVDGATKQRAGLLGELSEADVIHNGRNVWTYTSASNTVTHQVLPASHRSDVMPAHETPASAATELLKNVTPSTAVSVDTARTVADRAAYTLVISPRDARSTVRQIRIAIDAKTFVPLQLQVFGSGSSPAFEFGFTKVSFHRPAASTFNFAMPTGARLSNNPLTPDPHHAMRHHDRMRHRGGWYSNVPRTSMAPSKPSVIGSGWTSVVELPQGLGSQGGLLDHATTSVGSKGDRLLHTALVNMVIRPDGRTIVGAVDPSVIEHIASTSH